MKDEGMISSGRGGSGVAVTISSKALDMNLWVDVSKENGLGEGRPSLVLFLEPLDSKEHEEYKRSILKKKLRRYMELYPLEVHEGFKLSAEVFVVKSQNTRELTSIPSDGVPVQLVKVCEALTHLMKTTVEIIREEKLGSEESPLVASPKAWAECLRNAYLEIYEQTYLKLKGEFDEGDRQAVLESYKPIAQHVLGIEIEESE